MSRTEDDSQTAVERRFEQLGPEAISETDMWGRNRANLQHRLKKHPQLRVFWPEASNASYERSFSPGINHDGVVYHTDADRRNVVLTWLQANETMLEYSSPWAIYTNMTTKQDDDRLSDVLETVLKELTGADRLIDAEFNQDTVMDDIRELCDR